MPNINNNYIFSKKMKLCSIVCAVLVCWIHAYNIDVYGVSNTTIYWFENVISQGISRAAVPFFFMQSAFFYMMVPIKH